MTLDFPRAETVAPAKGVFIDNLWQPLASGRTIPVVAPAEGVVFAEIAAGGAAEVAAAAAATAAATATATAAAAADSAAAAATAAELQKVVARCRSRSREQHRATTLSPAGWGVLWGDGAVDSNAARRAASAASLASLAGVLRVHPRQHRVVARCRCEVAQQHKATTSGAVAVAVVPRSRGLVRAGARGFRRPRSGVACRARRAAGACRGFPCQALL